MGKKKRGHPDVEDVLARPWCYYCERDFEDLKLLISHQKAKHFKCDRCGRRLNTAGGLSVHLNQVHKETLSQVENALPNRQGLDVEIFGMEGIPQDILDQHRNRIIQNFYQAQEDRRIATGNPLPGQSNSSPRKKIKIETKEELLARLAEWRAQKKAKKEAPTAANGATDGRPAVEVVPGQFTTPHQQGTMGFEQHPMPGHYQHGQYPYAYAAEALPSRPPGAIGPAPGQLPVPGQGGSRNDAARPQTDDIDELIRMAEAGIRPPQHQDEADDGDKKAKKEKKGRLVYDDTSVSPEEKMAALPRYAFRQSVTA